jgi:organic radical activating enzyme
MLEINEIFGPTIQGEGKRIGSLCVFVRFGRCNMSCKGFNVEYETPSGIKKYSCDSYYACDVAFRPQWQQYKTADELIEQINKLMPQYDVDLVITGGEPLLYWNDIEFQKLLKYYLSKNIHITIETNASLDIDLQDWHKDILFSMSVKLSNTQEKYSKRINIATITKILNLSQQSYLKFVLDKDFLSVASNEIEQIVSSIPKCDIYVMPMGDTAQTLNSNSKSVVEYAIKKGYKYSDRLHIRIWNNKRGV